MDTEERAGKPYRGCQRTYGLSAKRGAMNWRFKSAAPVSAVIPVPTLNMWEEMLQVKGLMPLLIKRGRRQRWSSDEKAELRAHLTRLTNMSPYLLALALPGSFLMLPVLAWWLSRRSRQKQTA